uniref:Uncharacterized protein n=1 Tax=Glossina austeni TaxID=7395 RepID=A0A1A9VP40_GLOAU
MSSVQVCCSELIVDKAVDAISSKWMPNFDPNFQSSTWFASVTGSVDSNSRSVDIKLLPSNFILLDSSSTSSNFDCAGTGSIGFSMCSSARETANHQKRSIITTRESNNPIVFNIKT